MSLLFFKALKLYSTPFELRVDMYTPVHLKWITNKFRMDSTGSSAQYYVAAGMEVEFGRMDTCVCVAESLCCPPETITTL